MNDVVYLEEHDQKRNLHRFYRVLIEHDLFGNWVLTREWGHVGQGGGHLVVKEYNTIEAARQYMQQNVQEKLKRGYQII